MEEIWKSVIGFEGLYEISNRGRLRSVDKYVSHGRWPSSGLALKKGKIIKCFINEAGYWRTSLRKDGKYYNKVIHRLVAESFIKNPNNYPEVNHKDLNTLNCWEDNLEWCTHPYNQAHAASHGRYCPVKNPNVIRKLEFQDVFDIHRIAMTGLSQGAIGDLFGISQSVVGCILRGESWKTIYQQIKEAA